MYPQLVSLFLRLPSRGRAILLAGGGLFLAAGPYLRAEDAPGLNATPSGEQHVGKFQWADLFAGNATTEGEFYAKLFGWTTNKVEQNHHVVVQLSDGAQPIASIIERTSPKQSSSPARWIGYAAVSDLSGSIATVEKLGGKVLAKARKVPQRGEQAIVADHEGAVFGLIHSSSGDSPDYLPSAGELVWAELFSPTPKTAVRLYQKVFNYDAIADPGHEDGNHFLLSTGEFARAGVAPAPPWEGGKADWLIYFCVADATASANKASSLGATVVVAPHASRHGGKIAILADPEGGLIGLLELETATELKEAKP